MLYHRWIIRCIVRGVHFSNQPPGAVSLPRSAAEDAESTSWGGDKLLAIKYEEANIEPVDEKASVAFLIDLLKRTTPENFPEFLTQLAHELGEYHFFREKFEMAIDFLGHAEKLLKTLSAESKLSNYWSVFFWCFLSMVSSPDIHRAFLSPYLALLIFRSSRTPHWPAVPSPDS